MEYWQYVVIVVLLLILCITVHEHETKRKALKGYIDKQWDKVQETDLHVTDKWTIVEITTQKGDEYVFYEDSFMDEMDSGEEAIKISHNQSLYKKSIETTTLKTIGKGLLNLGEVALVCHIEFGTQSGRPIRIYHKDILTGNKDVSVCRYLDKDSRKFDTYSYWEGHSHDDLIYKYGKNVIR